VAFDLLTGEHSATAISIPVTLPIADKFKVNVNAGWLHVRTEDLDWVPTAAGFEWTFAKQLTLIGEVFGLFGQSAEPSSRMDPRAQLGLRYAPEKSVDVDVIYGRNVLGENADWITIGLSADPAHGIRPLIADAR
jgi:hypothetical protein